MSATLNERNPNIVIIPIGNVASSAAATLPGPYMRKHSKIKNAWYVDQAGVTASSSNYLTIQLQDNAGSPNAYAVVATSSAAAVALTPLALALSSLSDDSSQSVSQEEDVPAGTQLNVLVTPSGHAVATNAVLVLEYYPL